MKRNAKTLIAGMVALSISHAAMAEDIKVAVVGAMSGPVAQWGDMEFNGALCRGLKTTRYKELDVIDGEPTLVDFMLDRVPQRACSGRPAQS